MRIFLLLVCLTSFSVQSKPVNDSSSFISNKIDSLLIKLSNCYKSIDTITDTKKNLNITVLTEKDSLKNLLQIKSDSITNFKLALASILSDIFTSDTLNLSIKSAMVSANTETEKNKKRDKWRKITKFSSLFLGTGTTTLATIQLSNKSASDPFLSTSTDQKISVANIVIAGFITLSNGLSAIVPDETKYNQFKKNYIEYTSNWNPNCLVGQLIWCKNIDEIKKIQTDFDKEHIKLIQSIPQ